MPDFSLGLSNLFGKFSKDEKQPERRSTAGGQSGSRAYSDRSPTPKNFFGPLTGLGEAATSTALGLGNVLVGLLKAAVKFLATFKISAEKLRKQ